jgi:hypothetical protein
MNQPEPTPTIGRIVYYRINEQDAKAINDRYIDAMKAINEIRTGFQLHVGNHVAIGQILPMIIVGVWPGTSVNGQVILDGNDNFWVTSAEQGYNNGQWNWPKFV